ncbi:tRNA (adenosine(37)-N6)-threonylcarbamoyltransferase complex dimerization subunit type 1 TsaB [Candidatus Brocadia sapporoensis]|uniref:tRNA (Adenosine(37)-N6)-threonylcarbamoyltransferase complex dimerization subunit type 1 TsaB n=1 Tax=Candidatus Brocadia sapporoensis TaxID=392547 RepID=A0A1V6M1F4_9BACT|nr:tRNA (adenosine(37)-N6)-threonylcarbamoyltransferase complex dimerization subunit type 1 TsaB [Candidatus Brocadia sapporoensis]OQD46233.1 tRNA (adenosine(37)-N6)-threonylcarbamoyltransferase complex dimerization subunit type 1 TsaB [Candidatus Brocadia sapporoensis]GJQ24809.1 MAG: tRNA (adenosine(37)-N6)-threonylcarbamoyltransferase complex dimerization subunit type 1 TsaB [Candidatus Brocadia sapporoensis]
MKVLGIETSGDIGGVVLSKDYKIVLSKEFGCMQHSKELVPAIKSAFHETGWSPNDIDLIAVDVGPGSYTGLRVGVTCAKTLAYALQKPVIDVPIFDIIAENYQRNLCKTASGNPPSSAESTGEEKMFFDAAHRGQFSLCPVLDARRNHVYACIYTFSPLSSEQGLADVQWKRETEFMVIQPEGLVPLLPRPIIIFGNGVSPYREVFQAEDIFIDNEEWATPKVELVAILGEKMYESGHRCERDKLLPLYLRQAEAIEKQKGKK